MAQRERAELHAAAVGCVRRAPQNTVASSGSVLGELAVHVEHLGARRPAGGRRSRRGPCRAGGSRTRTRRRRRSCRHRRAAPRTGRARCSASTMPHLAVGGDQLDPGDVVDGQAVLAHQPAEPAAQRQPGHAGRATPPRPWSPARRRWSPGCTRSTSRRPGRRPAPAGVDVHAAHQRQVDHQPAVGDGSAGDVVAATAHRDLQAAVAPEVHGVARCRRRCGSARSPPAACRPARCATARTSS